MSAAVNQSLFAPCLGLLSRFQRGGRGVLFVRVCPKKDALGTPLMSATFSRGYARRAA